MKRWAVPVVPLAVSLCLSLSTVGPHPFWQDSGLYLTAIKEWGVLYAPGFVVYEVLCRLWTLLFFFVDFTLAVHLFSAVCAAGACAAIAVAVRDLLESKGGYFQILPEGAGDRGAACGMLAGVLLAGSFTFWSTAIYSKGYSFYYLVLCLLLWRMIRADETRRPRDFTIVSVLIGLAWQAHPSSTLLGLALAGFVAAHARALGAKVVFSRIAVAAAVALGPSLVLLPILWSRDPWLMFGRPQTFGAFLRYITGGHYAHIHGAFGLDAGRVQSYFRYLWEDSLGIGLLLALWGLATLARGNRRLLLGMLLWIVPSSVATILFKTEGQHDCWLVASRLPLWIAAGIGMADLTAMSGRRAAFLIAATGALATGWAVAVNYADLNQRHYRLAEYYGRVLVDTADPNAIVLLSGDDSNGLASYLQRVKGERPDLTLVTTSFLDSASTTGNDWYEASLLRRDPTLKRPDYEGLKSRFPGYEIKQTAVAAFVNANAGGSRPLLTEVGVKTELLRPDLQQVPAGAYWKVLPAAAAASIEERYWKFPIEPEDVRPQYRRARGQELTFSAEGVGVKPQNYESRLVALLLRARQRLALAQLQQQRFLEAARLCESIVRLDQDEFNTNPEFIHQAAISYYGAGQRDRAEMFLQLSARVSVRKENQASALAYLSEIAAQKGDLDAARRYREQALSIPGLDPTYLRELRRRLDPQ